MKLIVSDTNKAKFFQSMYPDMESEWENLILKNLRENSKMFTDDDLPILRHVPVWESLFVKMDSLDFKIKTQDVLYWQTLPGSICPRVSAYRVATDGDGPFDFPYAKIPDEIRGAVEAAFVDMFLPLFRFLHAKKLEAARIEQTERDQMIAYWKGRYSHV